MGKWDFIVDELEPDWGTDDSTQEKIDKLKEKILSGPGEEFSSAAVDELVMDISAQQLALNQALEKAANGDFSSHNLARIYRDIKRLRDTFHEEEKQTKLLLGAYGQLLIKQYETEKIRSIGFEEGGSVRTQKEPRAKVVDKIALRRWAIEQGLEDELTLPWPTVNSLVKLALDHGEAEPDGVDAVGHTKIVVMKE